MTRTPKPKAETQYPDKAQLDRFKETARELGCDETGEAFEKAFAKAVPAKKRQPSDAIKGPLSKQENSEQS